MGIANISQTHEEYRKTVGSGGNWIPELRLGDGDVAFVVFLATDEDDDRIDDAFIHELDVRPGNYNVEYCVGEDCQYCEDKVARKHYFGVWAFVQDVYYKSKPRRKEDLQQVDIKGVLYYHEPARAIWFWRSKYGQGDYIWIQVKENWENNGKTLMNRVYRISRRGNDMNSTNYTLLATNVMVDEEYIKKYGLDLDEASNLPDAKDVFKKRVAHENGKYTLLNNVVSLDAAKPVVKMDSFNDDPFAGMDVSPVKPSDGVNVASIQTEATKEVQNIAVDDVAIIQSEGEVPTALSEIRKRFKT